MLENFDVAAQILETVFGVEKSLFNEGSVADDFEFWDSFNTIRLALYLESEYGIMIDERALSRLETMKGICEILSSKSQW